MAKEGYPSLSRLLGELRQLDKTGTLHSGAARVKGGGRFEFRRGRDVGRFTWPGVGDFWLTRQQQEVVAILLDAYFECASPDVQQRYLLRQVGSDATQLATVFAESDAWGKLIVPGHVVGSYRLATPAETSPLDDADDERVEPDEWIA
jgi:hypothetical protein